MENPVQLVSLQAAFSNTAAAVRKLFCRTVPSAKPQNQQTGFQYFQADILLPYQVRTEY